MLQVKTVVVQVFNAVPPEWLVTINTAETIKQKDVELF